MLFIIHCKPKFEPRLFIFSNISILNDKNYVASCPFLARFSDADNKERKHDRSKYLLGTKIIMLTVWVSQSLM